METAYRKIMIGVSRWQWQVLRASAKAWRDKDIEAHAMMLLYAQIESISEDPHTEFEEAFPVRRRPWWGRSRSWGQSTYPAEFKGTGRATRAFRWHPRRWWRD